MELSSKRRCEFPFDVLSPSCCRVPRELMFPLACDRCAGSDRRLSPGRRTNSGRFVREGGTAGKGAYGI